MGHQEVLVNPEVAYLGLRAFSWSDSPGVCNPQKVKKHSLRGKSLRLGDHTTLR